MAKHELNHEEVTRVRMNSELQSYGGGKGRGRLEVAYFTTTGRHKSCDNCINGERVTASRGHLLRFDTISYSHKCCLTEFTKVLFGGAFLS